MTDWTALVPLKLDDSGKSRLSPSLNNAARADLAEEMARHVLSVLQGNARFQRVVVLAKARPKWWSGAWSPDTGKGLNTEIAVWHKEHAVGPLLIIHGDLPLLSAADVDHLLSQGEEFGAALATDRAGQGTNALALADGRDMIFRFGIGSRKAHSDQHADMPVIERTGLMADCDTPDDLTYIAAHQ